MLQLRKDIGRLVVKAMGITLTTKSSQKQLENALKHKPALKGLIIETKKTSNGEQKEKVKT